MSQKGDQEVFGFRMLCTVSRQSELHERALIGFARAGRARYDKVRDLDLIGKTLNRYHILEKLGQGGMGVVYLAEDTSLERKVALKFLTLETDRDPQARERFLLEAKAAAAIDHPYICKIHETGELEGRAFIAMEYVPGQSLGQRISAGPIPIEEALKIAREIAGALDAAHERGIVHRDLKPSNILLPPRGHAKVMDFGLAKRLPSGGEAAGSNSALTTAGVTLGTWDYMSPEQLRGREVGTDSDVFSFGTLIYEMLTGIQPFRKDTHMDTASAILNEQPADPSHLRREIPRDVDRTIEGMLAKTPEQRLGIKQVRAGLGEGRGPKADLVSWRRLAWGGALAVLLLVLLAVIFSPQFRQSLAPGDPVPTDKHLVILPFAFIGDESARRALCDGLVETLASKLTQLERFQGSLWVVPTSEVRSRTDLSVEAARKAFAVTLAVTGSWQQVADRIRLTLNLVDARNLRQIESTVIDHQVDDLAGLQDKAVFQMARMLSLELQPRELGILAAATPAQPRAYELYLQGRGFLQRYDKPESLNNARQAFAEAAKLDPVFALAHAGVGETFWKEYQSTRDTSFLQQAVGACRRALELDSQASAVNVTLGLVLQGTGEYEKAVQSFRKAIEIDPFNVEAYRGLGRAQESLGETEEAEKAYIKATQVRPEFWSVFNRLGSFYYRKGRYEEARTQFERVIALTPDNPRGYNNLGSLLSVLQRPSEARRMFERSLQAEPTDSAYSNLATLYFRGGRYEDAARMYAKVLERGSKNYTITKNLAHAYHFSGEAEKARQTYARAAAQVEDLRRINPRDAKIMVDLAQLYALSDRSAEALELLRLSLELAPEDVTVLAVAFETYEQLGEREMALKWIEAALERGYKLSSIESNPTLQDLRSDQRYEALALSK